jgi:hypothetical protein
MNASNKSWARQNQRHPCVEQGPFICGTSETNRLLYVPVMITQLNTYDAPFLTERLRVIYSQTKTLV